MAMSEQRSDAPREESGKKNMNATDWGKIKHNWLKSRQTLIVSYCKLASLQHLNATDTTELPNNSAFAQLKTSHLKKLAAFCQILIDYVSMARFEVFQVLADNLQTSSKDPQFQDKSIMSIIAHTESEILDFNDEYDKYLRNNSHFMSEDFINKLNMLGETLSLRFDVEDELIKLVDLQS